MKLALALAVLGATTGSTFGATISPISNHSSMSVPTLAAVGFPVPEPATLGILGVGAASLLLRRKRK